MVHSRLQYDLSFKVIGILTLQPVKIEHNFELGAGRTLEDVKIIYRKFDAFINHREFIGMINIVLCSEKMSCLLRGCKWIAWHI